MGQILVYMTAPNEDVAAGIGRALLEKRLAACVNILPGVRSMYWWDGEIQADSEVVLVAKTAAELFEELRACVVEEHPYEVPCIVAMDIDRGHEPFLRWVEGETRERCAARAPK